MNGCNGNAEPAAVGDSNIKDVIAALPMETPMSESESDNDGDDSVKDNNYFHYDNR